MPGKMKKLRYHLPRALTHPQFLSMVFALIVIVAWVHWRKPVGELKISPWVTVIFLAIIFRPAIVEILRRTSKISTSWAEVSMRQLEEDVERAEELNETDGPAPITVNKGRIVRVILAGDSAQLPPVEESSIQEQIIDTAQVAAELLKRIPDISLDSFKQIREREGEHNAIITVYDILQLFAGDVLKNFRYPGSLLRFDLKAAEYLTAVTGVSGWTQLAERWQVTMHHYRSFFRGKDQIMGTSELWIMLVSQVLKRLREQLRIVAQGGDNEKE
jgi:hypothetical protein